MRWVLALCVLAICAGRASAQVTFPERPGDREFIRDDANLIDTEAEGTIAALCDVLLTARGVPIVVVTIPSLGDHGAGGWSIERYAHDLFNEWEIGYARNNHGVLLLIARDDRKARIELGSAWGGGKHARSQAIMDALIIPRFKAGDFSGGIEVGAAALDAMVRDIAVPARYRPRTPTWVVLMWIAFVALAIFTVVSLSRRGASGYAWVMWGLVFTGLFLVLRGVAESAASRSGGGSFGGGSFGGGFSGGGGATGSW